MIAKCCVVSKSQTNERDKVQMIKRSVGRIQVVVGPGDITDRPLSFSFFFPFDNDEVYSHKTTNQGILPSFSR